ncbi:MAG: tol-pal system-associated acyl-CoA thioesterase [Candidatus Muproteobacteria bacterium RIFCSPHIGHO2_01_FULL_65_16]|uniref:Tol-pal system-associated acyl-CoA thioesterase n=1 Tax=Candidatus Muproteobacteria bacterium RIFCSPHIGHO2_01_FULL_65_16 TaxID=1817764 RepID=A0A1F6TKS6_9PROT|nr:MAG: tol-pal system-associated acyl-CoA thioesterase [Candidatus Muproteobacteria bacterium RIFCSPHIGHO2_01_FULL_65_16]
MTVFSIPIRVYYEDTDAGGGVYYANYLRFLERARTEWLRAMGFEQDELARSHGVLFAVRSARLDFLRPARLDDLLHATVDVSRRGAASMTFAQSVRRDDDTLCRGEVKVVCVDAAGFQPRALPDDVLARLTAGGAA